MSIHSIYIYTSYTNVASEVAVHGLAQSTNHSSMAEQADELNVLLIPHLWKATTVRAGLYVHEGIGVGLGCVALPTLWNGRVNVLIWSRLVSICNELVFHM